MLLAATQRTVLCTHLAIRLVWEDQFLFTSRKRFYSVNVQIKCDAKVVLTNVVAGSTHDSFIHMSQGIKGRESEVGAELNGFLVLFENVFKISVF